MPRPLTRKDLRRLRKQLRRDLVRCLLAQALTPAVVIAQPQEEEPRDWDASARRHLRRREE